MASCPLSPVPCPQSLVPSPLSPVPCRNCKGRLNHAGLSKQRIITPAPKIGVDKVCLLHYYLGISVLLTQNKCDKHNIVVIEYGFCFAGRGRPGENIMLKAITGSILTLAVIAGGAWGWVGLVLVLGTAVAGTAAWYIQKTGKVIIPELTMGTVYERKSERFLRFLPPGTHWINPATETLGERISTAGQTTSAHTKGIQAIGGLTLGVEWTLAYGLEPEKLTAEMRPKMARALPQKSAALAKQHLNNCLHHVIGEYTIEQLCQPGIHRQLEREVRQLARTRLEAMGFNIMRVMIEAVHMPAHVMQALETAHERDMQAENEARALERLQRVVSQFSKDDMERLMELERIHMLGKHGIPVVYPAMAEQMGVFNGRFNGHGRGQVVEMALS